MNEGQQLLSIYREASLGDVDAFAFILAFHGWAHLIDDLVDEPQRDRLEVVDVAMKANVLFSSPFYQAHAHVLSVVTCVIADSYGLSVRCEREGGDKAKLVDAFRLAGNQLVIAVAMLKGGWEHAQRVSAQLWPVVFQSQLGTNLPCTHPESPTTATST